jgi:hypothetical protein
MYFRITSGKAEILGLLCAEGNYRGYIDIYFEKNKKRKAVYLRERWKEIIEFSNTDISLLEHFVDLLSKEYNYKPKITKSNNNVFRVCITKINVIRNIQNYVDLGCLKWTVPSIILVSDFSIISSFVRGFFDGDGSVDFVDKKIPRIRFSSSNLSGLKLVSKLLESMNLKYSLNGPYLQNNKLPSFELLLKTDSVNDFINLIGSEHKNKNTRFKRIIAGANAEVDRIYPRTHNQVVRQIFEDEPATIGRKLVSESS